MRVECKGCGKAIGVGHGFPHTNTPYWEERDGLSLLAGNCPRNRINGALPCAASRKLDAMTNPEAFDAELQEAMA